MQIQLTKLQEELELSKLQTRDLSKKVGKYQSYLTYLEEQNKNNENSIAQINKIRKSITKMTDIIAQELTTNIKKNDLDKLRKICRKINPVFVIKNEVGNSENNI